jgi:hypothetical protein
MAGVSIAYQPKIVLMLALALLSRSARAWSSSGSLSAVRRRGTTATAAWTTSRLHSSDSATPEGAAAVAVPELRIPKKFVPFPFEVRICRLIFSLTVEAGSRAPQSRILVVISY